MNAAAVDPWCISVEERIKHDGQFLQLKPQGQFITGQQARDFFLKSGLPTPVLGHIWSLADLNADGKMDRKEFSIAVHLIKKKLQGFELPKVLPPSLVADPVPGVTVAPMGAFGMPAMTVHHGQMSMGVPVVPLTTSAMPGYAGSPAKSVSSVSGDWAIPSKLKYNQMFNSQDRARRGYLTGVEARSVLMQSGLPHPILAQVWNLADVDNDGRLTSEEFCLAMHLIDLAKMGQPLPAKLPPELVPPSYRRGRAGSGVGLPVPPQGGIASTGQPLGSAPGGMTVPLPGSMPQNDALADLLGGGFPPAASSTSVGGMMAPVELPNPTQDTEPPKFVTFEDKRKENFDKGQAELEKRRAQLRELQHQEEEARLAAERAEHEKKERIRQEQERKRHMELEKQFEKQRALEQERDEQRRKAWEQREAARRELERQRQLEWERQRRDQLVAEKQREQNHVDELQANVGKLKLELEALDNRKADLSEKMSQSRSSVTDLMSAIDAMRYTRDRKLTDIDRFQGDIQEWTDKVAVLQQERQQLENLVQAQSGSLGDMVENVRRNCSVKKQTMERQRQSMADTEKEMSSKLQQIDASQAELKELKSRLQQLQSTNQKLQMKLDTAATFDTATDVPSVTASNKPAPISDNNHQTAPSEDSWASSAFNGSSVVTTTAVSQDAWGSAFTSTSSTKSEDVWASDFASSVQPRSVWADSFFGAQTRETSGTPTSAGPTTGGSTVTVPPAGSGLHKYQALFQFDARNADELSFLPGDTIWVKADQSDAEPGWLGGRKGSLEGWFPEAYAQPVGDSEGVGEEGAPTTDPQQAAVTTDDQQFFGSEFVARSAGQPSEDQQSPVETGQADSDQAPSVLNTSDQSPFTAVPATLPSPLTTTETQVAPEGLQARALYPWRAKKDNHLTFNKGDVISVLEQQDIWWSGQLADKTGWFPKSYVKVIGVPPSVNRADRESSPGGSVDNAASSPTSIDVAIPAKEEQFVALYSYASNETGDLTFNQGDVITVSQQEGDWWTGSIGALSGIFPANYVQKMKSADLELGAVDATETHSEQTATADVPTVVPVVEPPASLPVTTQSKPSSQALQQPGQKLKKPEIASVLAPYQAIGPEQLSLQIGQLIQVRKKSPSGWWEGELQARGQKRKIGWFPANYVRILSSSSARSTPDTTSQQKSLNVQPGASTLSPSPLPDSDMRSATPVGYPAPTTVPSLEQVVALFDYAAQNDDELSFHKDSVINVISKDEASWWKGELNGQMGMFPANYITPLSATTDDPATSPATVSWMPDASVAAVTSPMEGKRQNYIHELVNTEQTYLQALSVIYDVFERPLREEGILTTDQLQAVFVNLKEIIVCNTKLVKALRVRKKLCGEGHAILMIGDILCENLPHMTPYIRFCSCQLNASNLIQYKTESDPRFRETSKLCCQDVRSKGMPISSFLLKPMQRITKYPLIIQNILKYTPPGHPDREYLDEALSRATEVCNQVNEGVKEKDNSDKLEWIQTHVHCEGLPENITFNSGTNSLGPRKFLISGTLYKCKSGKQLVGFLFNDFLLLTQPQTTLADVTSVFSFDIQANTQFKMYRNPIFLNEVVMKKSPEMEADNCVFQLSHNGRVYVFRAVTATERDNWVKKIEEASRQFLDMEKKKKEIAQAAKRISPVGRLLVVIVGGTDLTPGENGKSDPYCEVSMGIQEHRTRVISGTPNPRWNASMQFIMRDLQEDVLCITVYDRDFFTPNDFLGRTEIRIQDILKETRETKGPILKQLELHEVNSGKVELKLDLQLFENT